MEKYGDNANHCRKCGWVHHKDDINRDGMCVNCVIEMEEEYKKVYGE